MISSNNHCTNTHIRKNSLQLNKTIIELIFINRCLFLLGSVFWSWLNLCVGISLMMLGLSWGSLGKG